MHQAQPERSAGPDFSPRERRPPLSLRANLSWTFAGNTLNALCQWGTLAVLARLGTTEVVGTYALALAITTPIFMLLNLQLRSIQVADAAGRFSFGTIWRIRATTTTLAIIIVGSYAALSNHDSSLTYTLILLSFSKASQALSDCIHGRIQRRERLDWIARSVAVRGMLSFAFMSIAFYVTESLPISAATLAAANILALLVFDFPALDRLDQTGHPRRSFIPAPLRLPFVSSELAPLLRSALPLGGTMMLVSLNSLMPRYFIEAELGRAPLGVFSALTQLIAAGNLVVSAAAQSASPRLATLAHLGNVRSFYQLLKRLYLLVGAIAAAGLLLSLLFGPTIVSILLGPEYANEHGLLVLLTIAGGTSFASSISGYGLTASGAHGIQLPLFSAISVLTLLLCNLLVPNYGLHGAAYSLVGANLLQLILSQQILNRQLNRRLALNNE